MNQHSLRLRNRRRTCNRPAEIPHDEGLSLKRKEGSANFLCWLKIRKIRSDGIGGEGKDQGFPLSKGRLTPAVNARPAWVSLPAMNSTYETNTSALEKAYDTPAPACQ